MVSLALKSPSGEWSVTYLFMIWRPFFASVKVNNRRVWPLLTYLDDRRVHEDTNY